MIDLLDFSANIYKSVTYLLGVFPHYSKIEYGLCSDFLLVTKTAKISNILTGVFILSPHTNEQIAAVEADLNAEVQKKFSTRPTIVKFYLPAAAVFVFHTNLFTQESVVRKHRSYVRFVF